MMATGKGGNFGAAASSLLLEFLGVKKDAAGVQRVAGEVELIAAAPFRLGADGEAAKWAAWTFSTFDLDRAGERIDPAGWDFTRFLDNPVVEWAHRYDIPAIGRAEGLRSDDKGLHGVVVFNDREYDPFGWAIGERVKRGVIRAGSVGFRPLEVELPSREDAKDGTALIFRKQELVEFSVCNVPANPFALSKPANADTRRELSRSMFWGGLINNF
jgi:HK97 family phage prohead protease